MYNQCTRLFIQDWMEMLLTSKMQIKRLWYRSPTKIPNRDKKTESPYLVHPLTYRQVYLTKDAYFVEKIHCELVEMTVGQRMNKIRFSCHNIYWFGFLVTIRNFRRAPVQVNQKLVHFRASPRKKGYYATKKQKLQNISSKGKVLAK